MKRKSIVFLIALVLILSGCQSGKQHVKKRKKEHKHQNKIENKYDKRHHKDEKNLVEYDGKVSHVFFHPIISDPQKAYTDNQQQAKGNYDWMVTVNEFNKAIEKLHENNYILIDPHDAYDLESTPVKRKKLKLPKGKKPLIMSMDDMNYYEYMQGNGYTERLTLNKDNETVAEKKNDQGKMEQSKTNDAVPLLNDYVKKHPDFSYKGQKAVVGLTGYEGVLGYRTNDLEHPNYEKRKKQAKKVADSMKRDGWTFASHSYGHINFEDSSDEQIIEDTKRWKKEVEPIVGKTDLFIFPHGAQDRNSTSYNYMIDEAGFKYMAGVGPDNFTSLSNKDIYQDRVAIDGLNLHQFKYKLKPFFKPEEVYNKEDRQYYKGNKDYEIE
ncbi:polysaccharide deacetylase [Mammaliicoccus lentus]|uniref:polysaccharide deacetylase family protein n=1 Tax=Mammaliicoccus TaxID=2803850 RepID=UPI0007D9A281|nr:MULTISPECIES: polysaccharide deacetylase family protein [Mammaliicoccus]MCD2479046.1 polysaccharide deacetylase family protein [Mammaliicoccus lentus]MCD2521285.1 polysaccharide deacetylase family protein [Mammaliicoccus lentus]MEB5686031.1 polysaccharide deacetylase family protein [Mammaliicoccus lentus]OAO30381.1 polysaccharide deacetylase [Mammaliicoccus lentus]QMU10070.1 polysaccharide deacetylase family protein [Mammaliicoccus lentus]